MLHYTTEEMKAKFFEKIPATGWLCSICYEPAHVQSAGETMCTDHARRWNHGYGESIKQLKEKK